MRVVAAYGVTDRHGPAGAVAGLAENERFLRGGGRGLVGIHAAFTCSDATIEAAAGLAQELGVGVHVHVAEGDDDRTAAKRLGQHTTDDWLLVHCVHLSESDGLRGTIAHNPRSNMNNAVGYARPTRFPNRVVLGTDGIGADMLEEFRLAYARLREDNVEETPETVWGWLENGYALVPEARNDMVTWSYEPADPWRLAFTTGVRAVDVVVDGEAVLRDGRPTRVDADEIRAHATEQAERMFARL